MIPGHEKSSPLSNAPLVVYEGPQIFKTSNLVLQFLKMHQFDPFR